MNDEIRKNLAHALLHMQANKCLDDQSGGWYCGKKSDFQKRHVKAIAYFEKLLDEANEIHETGLSKEYLKTLADTEKWLDENPLTVDRPYRHFYTEKTEAENESRR